MARAELRAHLRIPSQGRAIVVFPDERRLEAVIRAETDGGGFAVRFDLKEERAEQAVAVQLTRDAKREGIPVATLGIPKSVRAVRFGAIGKWVARGVVVGGFRLFQQWLDTLLP